MNAWTLSAVVAAVALLVLANRRADLLGTVGAVAVDPPYDSLGGAQLEPELEQGQGGGVVESALASLDPSTYWPAMTDEAKSAANLQAFLMMIRKSEGTDGANGYRTLFGYRYFNDYTDHPRKPAQFSSNGQMLWTSAAGAYQIMAISPLPGGGSTRVDTWDRMQRKLSLPDFSPESQDAAAVGLIDEAGALNDARAGRFDAAVGKVSRIWASLPGAGYGQPERSLETLRTAYLVAGGSLA